MEERHHNQKKIYKISFLQAQDRKNTSEPTKQQQVTDSKGFDGTRITINKI